MLTSFAVILRIISNSTANLFQKKSAEVTSPLYTNLFSYLMMSLICIIPAMFVNWGHFSIEFWGYVIIAGTLCTIGTIALIEALNIGELSVLAPINSYKSIIGIISAFVLLGEIPTIKDFVCIIFIIIGSYFVLDTKTEPFSLKTFLRKDVLLRIFALICSGTEASFLKKIILISSYKISLILWCFSGFLCSLILYIFMNEHSQKLNTGKNYVNCFVIAITLIIMQLTTNYIFTKMDVGSALALFQLSSLVSLYFGYKIFHEQNMRRKILGTVIMITSAGMILLG